MMRLVSQLSKLVVIGVFAFLAGCATQPPIVTSNIVKPPPVSIPVPTPTNLQNMKYQLLTGQTLPTFQAAIATNPAAQFYVLDRTNMEIMISNVQELRRYILEQQATITYLGNVLKSQQNDPSSSGKDATATNQTK
jgi:hypothetical protein